jgi:hypothetical protein
MKVAAFWDVTPRVTAKDCRDDRLHGTLRCHETVYKNLIWFLIHKVCGNNIDSKNDVN